MGMPDEHMLACTLALPRDGGIRRYRRFAGWNYAKGASLFITIATEPRRAVFGSIENGVVRFSPLGKIVAEALEAIPRLNPGLRLHGHVVMPDHVHFNCYLASRLGNPSKMVEIAAVAQETTMYWKSDGPHVTARGAVGSV